MTRNDTQNKLERSSRPRSEVDSAKCNWGIRYILSANMYSGTNLITVDMDVTCVMFNRNSVVQIQMNLLDHLR